MSERENDKKQPAPEEKKKPLTPKEEQKEGTTDHPEESEDPFDFGGLPKRDLKKNLGCG